MKKIKLIFSSLFLLALVIGCTVDGIGEDTSFVNSLNAPANVTAYYNITQDNTGLVTITPNGDGAVSYKVYYGDNTTEPVTIQPGNSTSHIYAEGIYTVKIVATGITGIQTVHNQNLVVSFKAPKNLDVTITNDLAVSKKVNVTLTADYATMFEVYFGDSDTPISANIGETASYVFTNAGTYTIRVVAKSAAIETTEYSEDFIVTAILQPTVSAPAPPNRQAANVISIYGSKYTNITGTDFFPDWGQAGQGSSWSEFDLNGDKMLNYTKLSYQGIALDENVTIDVTTMEFLHMDVWTADLQQLETFLISKTNGEKAVVKNLVANEWTSIEIPVSAFTSQGLTVADIFQLKLVGTPWASGTVFIDNIYFYKEATPSTGLEGTWKMAPEAGAFKVGPTAGSGDWYSNPAQAVIDRACYFDDTYVFATDGSFQNILGTQTWLEKWQGVAEEECGTPVAPHNGVAGATYIYDAVGKTIKILGEGAYLGLPKANNAGELPKVAVPASITYDVTLSDNNNTMNLVIETESGVFWSFKLVRI